jgi:hypothetical protein
MYQFSNNLHIYERHWHLLEIPTMDKNPYSVPFFDMPTIPLLDRREDLAQLRDDCEKLVRGLTGVDFKTNWAREVITLQRVETEDNQPLTCSLTMTKRRLRSNIKCFEKGAPTSKIYIRHSPTPDKHGMIWQQCYKPEPVEEKPKKRK